MDQTTLRPPLEVSKAAKIFKMPLGLAKTMRHSRSVTAEQADARR
jgi:hypothetical protein